MELSRKQWYLRGLKAGLPIGLGYFAVSFALGISARNAGLTWFQASLTSFLINASAGEKVGFTMIQENAGYIAIAIGILVANARYILMSFSLSQKLHPKTGLLHRLIIGWYVTDEVFGVSISAPGYLEPFYTYGAISLACPGWAIGTGLGVIAGNLLPTIAGKALSMLLFGSDLQMDILADIVVRALSVALYGMFISVFVPPSKTNKTVLILVLASMASSFAFSVIPMINTISSGTRTIILTVIISAIGAFVAPIREEGSKDAA